MLKDIKDLSKLVASCFNVPEIHVEEYSWVHTVYLMDEEGVSIGEIIVSRCDKEGLLYDLSIPDYDRRRILCQINIEVADEDSIKSKFLNEWNAIIRYKMKQVALKHKNLGSMLVISEREINK